LKFAKEFLVDLAWETHDDDIVTIMSSEAIGKTRWKIQHELIFKFEDKFYQTFFEMPATEMQDCGPYEFEDDEIECVEVEPYEVTITKYRIKKV
jgi:hypothetical protein